MGRKCPFPTRPQHLTRVWRLFTELHLVPEMTVAENIYLGQLPHKGGIVNRSLLNYEAGLQLKHLGMDIDPDTPLKYLSIGQWQMVEIAKALARNAKIIAFDEPTSSSLPVKSTIFSALFVNCERGRVILYVSHRMEEIFALSDAITVFKDGRYVKTFTDMQQVDHDARCRRWSGATSVISTAGNRVVMARSACVLML